MRLKLNVWLIVCQVVLAAGGFTIFAQSNDRAMTCDGGWNDGGGRRSYCEIKEATIPAVGAISVDGRQNGGVSVKGWARAEILVRAKIQTSAPTDDEARALVNEIRVETGGTQIHATGPGTNPDRQWSVSYEVFVPRRSDLTLKAHNGGISIRGVAGRIEFETVNGGVALRELAGNVNGKTTNGGLSIVLNGSRWDGEGLDVRTTNGGVSRALPENYSARLEASTVNGGMKFDFPITVQGKIERDIAVDIGGGGPKVRTATTNGGISIKKISDGGR